MMQQPLHVPLGSGQGSLYETASQQARGEQTERPDGVRGVDLDSSESGYDTVD